MSASQEKKRRQGVRGIEQDKLAAEKAAAQKKKAIARVRNTIIAVVVVLVIAAIVVINSNLFYTGLSAVEINGMEWNVAHNIDAHHNHTCNPKEYNVCTCVQ